MSELFSNSNLPYHLATYGWFAQEPRTQGFIHQPMTAQEYALLCGHFNFATQQSTRGDVWLPYNEDTNCSELENKVRWAINNPIEVNLECENYTPPFGFEIGAYEPTQFNCWPSWVSHLMYGFGPAVWRQQPETIGLGFIKDTATEPIPFFYSPPIDESVYGSIGIEFIAGIQFYKPHIVETDLTEIILNIHWISYTPQNGDYLSGDFQLGVTLADFGDATQTTVIARLDLPPGSIEWGYYKEWSFALSSNCTSWALNSLQARLDLIPM